MARTLLDKSIPLSIEPDTRTTAQNPYVSKPAIQRLADLASRERAALWAIASFVSIDALACGYTHEVVQQVRVQAGLLRPAEIGKELVAAFEQVSQLYTGTLSNPNLTDKQRGGLRGNFTAAISQAIVHKLLIAAGRNAAMITEDARVYENRIPVNSCNIDVVWADRAAQAAEAYECKNHPLWLLGEYATRNAPGNARRYKTSQLYLMLRFRELLEIASWKVLLACVTLRRRRGFAKSLEALVEQPDRFTIYSVEDFGHTFPPPTDA